VVVGNGPAETGGNMTYCYNTESAHRYAAELSADYDHDIAVERAADDDENIESFESWFDSVSVDIPGDRKCYELWVARVIVDGGNSQPIGDEIPRGWYVNDRPHDDENGPDDDAWIADSYYRQHKRDHGPDTLTDMAGR